MYLVAYLPDLDVHPKPISPDIGRQDSACEER